MSEDKKMNEEKALTDETLEGVAGGRAIIQYVTCTSCRASWISGTVPKKCPHCGGTHFTVSRNRPEFL